MGLISKFLGDIISPNNKAVFSQLQLYNGVSNGAPLMSAKVTLTAAQVKALFTTPITLIPAQGANTYIEVLACVVKLDFGTVAFTGANDINLQYTSGSGAAATTTLPHVAFVNSASTTATKILPVAVIPVANAPIVAAVGTANPGAGDSTITFDLFYRVNSIA